MKRQWLISRHRRIHLLAPGVDAAGHVLDVFEPLIPQPLGDSGASAAVMAMDDDPLTPVRLQVPQPRRDGPHRDLHRALDRGGGKFVRLADIEQHEPFPVRLHLLDGEDVDIRRQRLAIHGKPAPIACRINSRQPIPRLQIRPHPVFLMLDPALARQFAIDVVEKLRAAGHQALWAGGCVRDQLLGKTPKDYDVATDAEPERIRDIFGRKRTLAIGAAFGVITVLGPKDAGQIEVATFRRDLGYSDGRRPDAVAFTSAEEDAKRRDFTINGIFFDPVAGQYHDFVGGQDDLQKRLIRAIGDPHERFAEDKLRMLRAVRFAANFDFEIDPSTLEAVRQRAPDIRTVSAERITAEMRRMLLHESRVRAILELSACGLLREILPEVPAVARTDSLAWDRTVRILGTLEAPSFAIALAALLREVHAHRGAAATKEVLTRWKLPNEDRDGALRLLHDEPLIRTAESRSWPEIQRVLIGPRVRELIDFSIAVAMALADGLSGVVFCGQKLDLPPAALNPPPLITGEELKQLGIELGPAYKEILESVRDEQLEGRVGSLEEAIEFIQSRFGEHIRRK
jgi:poly(A) polymerase